MPAERMIVVDPEVMNGMPCFRGTRVPFKNLMDYLEGGHSLGEFLHQFPTITREMAVQALHRSARIAARQNRMKILLDECLPVDFRHSFPNHETHSAEWAGLKGRKNGELLHAAEAGGYQVLLTVDHGIPRQQTMAGRSLAIILIRSRTNQLEDLLPRPRRLSTS